MLGLFLASASAVRRPIVLAPPLFGSHLHVTAKDFSSHWYCKKNLDDAPVWLSEGYLIPPIINCMAQYLTTKWDAENKTIRNQTNCDVWTPDFGGDSSLRYIDEGVVGLHLISDLVQVLEEFEGHGYVVKTDIFGAPYDWRHGPLFIDGFYQQYIALVEQIYNTTGQKVVLWGFSMGVMVTHWLLTKKVTQEWKDKYIDRVILTCPSFGGSMDAVKISWDRWLDKLPEIMRTESLETLFSTVPTMFSHFPNVGAYGDQVVIRGPNNTEITAKTLADFMAAQGKIVGEAKEMLYASRDVYDRDLDPVGVDTYIIYNSGLDTVQTLEFPNGFDEAYVETYEGGDNTIAASTIRYVCEKWAKEMPGKTVMCHDFNSSSSSHTHITLLAAKEFTEMVYDITNADDWKVPGLHNIVGTNITAWKKNQ